MVGPVKDWPAATKPPLLEGECSGRATHAWQSPGLDGQTARVWDRARQGRGWWMRMPRLERDTLASAFRERRLSAGKDDDGAAPVMQVLCLVEQHVSAAWPTKT